jgi:hypothetical protein
MSNLLQILQKQPGSAPGEAGESAALTSILENRYTPHVLNSGM